VSVERTFRCDGDDCNFHVLVIGRTFTRNMVSVVDRMGAGEQRLHFCSWDCVLKHGAKIPPMVTVPMDDEDES
jgi:hypothetical protein